MMLLNLDHVKAPLEAGNTESYIPSCLRDMPIDIVYNASFFFLFLRIQNTAPCKLLKRALELRLESVCLNITELKSFWGDTQEEYLQDILACNKNDECNLSIQYKCKQTRNKMFSFCLHG